MSTRRYDDASRCSDQRPKEHYRRNGQEDLRRLLKQFEVENVAQGQAGGLWVCRGCIGRRVLGVCRSEGAYPAWEDVALSQVQQFRDCDGSETRGTGGQV